MKETDGHEWREEPAWRECGECDGGFNFEDCDSECGCDQEHMIRCDTCQGEGGWVVP